MDGNLWDLAQVFQVSRVLSLTEASPSPSPLLWSRPGEISTAHVRGPRKCWVACRQTHFMRRNKGSCVAGGQEGRRGRDDKKRTLLDPWRGAAAAAVGTGTGRSTGTGRADEASQPQYSGLKASSLETRAKRITIDLEESRHFRASPHCRPRLDPCLSGLLCSTWWWAWQCSRSLELQGPMQPLTALVL